MTIIITLTTLMQCLTLGTEDLNGENSICRALVKSFYAAMNLKMPFPE